VKTPDAILAHPAIHQVLDRGADGLAVVLTSPRGVALRAIASWGLAWDHVSVSTQSRCPSWDEMAFVKAVFWADDECVMQLHVETDRHVNHHPYCLHLWRPQDVEIPRPPLVCV